MTQKPFYNYFYISVLYMKAGNIFHIVVIFPLILLLVYKERFPLINQDILKNVILILVLLGAIVHVYKLVV
jgi:hypothetical protein